MTNSTTKPSLEKRLSNFRASRTRVEDLSQSVGDVGIDGQPGWLYCGSLYIEDTSAWDRLYKTPEDVVARGKYSTTVGNESRQSDDLDFVELFLFSFADSEGYLDSDTWDQPSRSPSKWLSDFIDAACKALELEYGSELQIERETEMYNLAETKLSQKEWFDFEDYAHKGTTGESVAYLICLLVRKENG